MSLSYEEAMACEVTRQEAMNEIARQTGESFEDFVAMHGDKETYQGSDVLEFLGW